MNLQERYKEADFLQSWHIEAAQQFFCDHPRGAIAEFIHDNMLTCHIGRTAFQALVHTPLDPSDRIIVMPTGYGTGLNEQSVARAMAIREQVDPHATLAMQGNMSPMYYANNFSPEEEKILDKGDFGPMRDRLNAVFEVVQRRLPDATAAYVGSSLGGALVGSALGHADEMVLEAEAAIVVDPANITERNRSILVRAFAHDVGEMTQVGMAQFPRKWWLQEPKEGVVPYRDIKDRIAIGGVAHYVRRYILRTRSDTGSWRRISWRRQRTFVLCMHGRSIPAFLPTWQTWLLLRQCKQVIIYYIGRSALPTNACATVLRSMLHCRQRCLNRPWDYLYIQGGNVQ